MEPTTAPAQPCCERFKDCYCKMHGALNRLQCLFLLALRLYFGISFFLAGMGKLANLERTTMFFGSLGIPLPAVNAVLAGGTEMIGGLLLALGLFSRLTALPLIFTMCVAYATAHTEELGALFTDPAKFLEAPPFLFLLTSLIVLLFGPGRISLDYLLKKRCCAKSGTCTASDTNSPCCSV